MHNYDWLLDDDDDDDDDDYDNDGHIHTLNSIHMNGLSI